MKGRGQEALSNLAFLRRLTPTDPTLVSELAEIEAAVQEERDARVGLGLKEAFFGPGNFIRFVIVFVMFTFQVCYPFSRPTQPFGSSSPRACINWQALFTHRRTH